MIPSWMTEDVEQQKRERARRDRPQLEIELPVPTDAETRRPRKPSSTIVIEFGAEALGA